jgi:calcineurin-like phosphoesterase family protein
MQRLPLSAPFWVTSDSHWNHGNIQIYQKRPANHNELMVERWQQAVPEDGAVLHLGDLHLGKKEDMPAIARALTGARKLLLLGNHDRTGSKGVEWYESLGFEVLGDGPLVWQYGAWTVTFKHEPYWPAIQYDPAQNLMVHGHVHRASRENRRMINVSVEVTDYRPVEITALLDERIAELAAADARPRKKPVRPFSGELRYDHR